MNITSVDKDDRINMNYIVLLQASRLNSSISYFKHFSKIDNQTVGTFAHHKLVCVIPCVEMKEVLDVNTRILHCHHKLLL